MTALESFKRTDEPNDAATTCLLHSAAPLGVPEFTMCVQHSCPEQKPHQLVLQLPILAHQHPACHAQVAVKPGMPESTPIWLHIDHEEVRLDALGDRLQLEAGTAGQTIAGLQHSVSCC